MRRQDLQTIPLDLLVERAPKVAVGCKCNDCGRIVDLPAAQLLDHLTIKKIDRRTPIWDIGRHLTCSACRSRDVGTKVNLAPFMAIDGFSSGQQAEV